MRDAIARRMNSAFSGPRYMSTPPPIVCAIPPGTVSAYVSFPAPYTRSRPRSLSGSLAFFRRTLVGFRQKYPLSPNRGTGWNLRHTRNTDDTLEYEAHEVASYPVVYFGLGSLNFGPAPLQIGPLQPEAACIDQVRCISAYIVSCCSCGI